MTRHVKGAHKPEEYERRGYDLISAQTWFSNVPDGMGVWWRFELALILELAAPIPKLAAVEKSRKRARRAPEQLPDLFVEHGLVGTQLKDDFNPFLQRTG